MNEGRRCRSYKENLEMDDPSFIRKCSQVRGSQLTSELVHGCVLSRPTNRIKCSMKVNSEFVVMSCFTYFMGSTLFVTTQVDRLKAEDC